jgi:SPP1 family predicted phage head-tail adaptor
MTTGAGVMRDRIEIQQFKSQSDGQGGSTAGQWSKFLRAWAEVVPKVGHARLMAMDAGTVNPFTITLRYRKGVTPLMRVKFGTRIFSIVQPINVDELGAFLQLECSEVTG